jgi:hypothetical protein
MVGGLPHNPSPKQRYTTDMPRIKIVTLAEAIAFLPRIA